MLCTFSPNITFIPSELVPALQNTSLSSVKSATLTALYFISASEVHPLNADELISVTLSGILKLVSELHPLNADEPMLSSKLFSPNVMLSSEQQPENAL